MMELQDYSLRKLKGIGKHMPAIKGLIELPLVESYEEFIHVLYADIDASIRMLEESRQHLQNDTEDRLTIQILSNLKMKGYLAEHDTQIGGHVDLVVKHNEYLWLGEAKIHSDYDHLYNGFLQLMTRYSTATNNADCGGMIIYIRRANAKQVMERWTERLGAGEIEIKSSEPCSCNNLAFYTTHLSSVSGNDYKIRHVPVCLHFEPQDKSGLKRKVKESPGS